MQSLQELAAYVAGIVDGEGHIGCHRTARGHWTRSIGICNTDKALIDTVINAFSKLGFATRATLDQPQQENWSPRWTLYVAGGREAFQRFAETIPIQAPAKKASLTKILETYELKDREREKVRAAKSTPCEVCGVSINASPAHRSRGGGRYCSRLCRGLAQRNRKSAICLQCDAVFEVIASRAATAMFCSPRCSGAYKAVHDGPRLASMARHAAAVRWGK